MINNSTPLVFFGTPENAVEIFEYLRLSGYVPSHVVTNPDKPQGRKMIMTPPPVKVWALEHNISVLQPENLKDPAFSKILTAQPYALFIVVAYGGIIPKSILDIPKYGSVNVHYSLLPKYRGASPVESQIINDDRRAGISILLLDEKMDHGPIIARESLDFSDNLENQFSLVWPPSAVELRKLCNTVASKLLVGIIPKWIKGEIQAVPQNHLEATYCHKIENEDRCIDFSIDSYKNYLKIQAYKAWGCYFYANKAGKKIRVNIKSVSYRDGKLTIERVVPEGKKEMPYEDFLRGINSNLE